MRKTRNLLLALATILCVLMATVMVTSAAETDTLRGLEAVLLTDKDNYATGEDIRVSVHVKNNNSYDVNGVSISVELPEGLNLKSGTLSVSDVDIAAGETYSNEVIAVKEFIPPSTDKPAVTPTDSPTQSQTNMPTDLSSTENHNTGSTDNVNVQGPKTGDNSHIVLWLVLMMALCTSIFLLIRFRKKSMKFLSLFLCALMVCAMMPTDAFATDTDDDLNTISMTVDKTIMVDGTEMIVKGTVSGIPFFKGNEASSHRVTFDANDGSSEVFAVQVLTPGEKAVQPINNPEREMYSFTGWYTEPAAITEYDFNADVTGDLTLYAGWGNPNGSTDGIYAASNKTETIYSISDIIVNGNYVSITYNTNDVVLMAVEFIPDKMFDGEWTAENLNSNLSLEPVATASGYTEKYGELITITLPIMGTLPEHYLVRASLLDDEHSSISAALTTYVTTKYTGTYSRFDDQTTDDFDDDFVVNFDQDDTTNFGVLNESVIVIPSDCRFYDDRELMVEDLEDESNIDSSDEWNGEEYEPQMENLVPDHLFTFPDKNGVISVDKNGNVFKLADLHVGDIIYIEGTTWMFKIATVTINDDDSISFTQDKDTVMSDFYDVLKVDFEGAEAVESDIMPCWEVVDVDASGSVTVGPFKVQNEFSNGVKLSGGISGKVTGKVEMNYDAHLFSKDYFEAKVSFITENTGEVKAELERNNENEYQNVVFQVDTRKIKLPTPVTGLDIYIKPAVQLQWKLSGNVSFNWTSKQTSGFNYNSDTGRTDIKKKENTVSLMAKGSAEAKLGPIFDIGIELFNGVLSGGVVAEAGAKLSAEAEIPVNNDMTNTADFKHACGLCVSVRADWYATATAKVKYKLTDHFTGDIVSAKILDFTAPITFNAIPGKFFVSVINSPDSPFGGECKIGGGECTNKTYRTEFLTKNQNGETINNIHILVINQGNHRARLVSSPCVEYLYEGTYSATANMNNRDVTKTVTVSDSRQTVILSPDTTNTILEGTVINANNRNESITGASVKVTKGNVVVASTTTDNNGMFRVTVPNGSLTVKISKENYIPFTSAVSIYEGETTHSMKQIELAPGMGMGGFQGTIRDAVTNDPLEGVTLNLYEGWNSPASPNTAKRTLTTDSSGRFRCNTITLFGKVVGLPSGNYTLTASKDGYSDTSYNIVIYPGTTDENPEINETMSPEMSDGFYRIILTWGVEPEDLDSHLVADADHNNQIHTYFNNMEPTPNYANLDVDDTTSYGPETITITNFEKLHNIHYAVHDYTNKETASSNALANSGAVVRLYKGNHLLRTFNVPTGYKGTEWDVFSLDSTGRITVLNSMTDTENSEDVLSNVSRTN